MTPVLEIAGLTKRYARLGRAPRTALDAFDMVVGAGQVHGFLGPNGSGKTTTLRTLLGLVRADAGTMTLLGQPVPDALPAVIGRVGAVVESPRFFANFSGRRTLELLAGAGGIPAARVDEVLETTGLRDRAKERVKTYSLGMKQRLAIASALLKKPSLLILDEPSNGLDPGGIREMRELMRSLTSLGVTVVLSSHILGEVQQICDSVTIISGGSRVTHGSVADVLATADTGEHLVRVADLARATEVLSTAGYDVRAVADHLVVSGEPDAARITERLGGAGLWVTELTPVRPDLEHVFLELTGTMPTAAGYRQVDDPPRQPGATGASDSGPAAGALADDVPAGSTPAGIAPVGPVTGEVGA